MSWYKHINKLVLALGFGQVLGLGLHTLQVYPW